MVFEGKTPTVFITGINGFTGAHLRATLLSNGYRVHGLVRDRATNPGDHVGDLNNRDELVAILKKIRPDYIVHLAAVSFVAHENANDFYQNNLCGTLALLEAIKNAGLNPQKILIASSANVYGNPTQIPITENATPDPINHYASSKLAMENMVRIWFSSFPIVMTRPFNYTGPGQAENFLVPKIVAHFRAKNKTIKLGNLDVTRDISDISLVTNSYMALMEHSVHSEIFNVCSGVGYSLADILAMMHEISGYRIQVEVDAGLVRSNEIKILIGSNQKINQVIGKVPAPLLFDTLNRMHSSVPCASVTS